MRERLNAVGFNIHESLAGPRNECTRAIGSSDLDIARFFDDWLPDYDSSSPTPIPTRRPFLDVLKEMGLTELSQQISDYLSDSRFF